MKIMKINFIFYKKLQEFMEFYGILLKIKKYLKIKLFEKKNSGKK